MLLKNLATMALAAGFAIGTVAIASAQNAPGPGASEYAPGHSSTNIPPGQGGVKGTTWTPPGKMMQKDRALKAKASAKTKSSTSVKAKTTVSKNKAQLKAKGSVN